MKTKLRFQSLLIVLQTFLLSNLFVIRYFKPIFSFLEVFSFRIWIDALLLATFLFNPKAVKRVNGGYVLVFMIFCSVVFLNFLEHGLNLQALIQSTNLVLLLGIPLFFASLLSGLTSEKLEINIQRLILFLNIFFFLNSIFILLQSAGVLQIPNEFANQYPFLVDHYSGSIGMNGVNTLNFLMVSTIVGNLSFWALAGKQWNLWVAIIQIGIGLIISEVNENKMFLVVLFSAIMTYCLFFWRDLGKKFILIFLVFLTVTPIVTEKIKATFSSKSGVSQDLIHTLIYDPNYVPNLNNERAYINYQAYKFFNAFETGIGLSKVSEDSIDIHKHIGINSATLLLIQGGIPLLVSVVSLLVVSFLLIIGIHSALSIIAVTQFAFVAVYASNPVTDRYSMIAICILMYFFASFIELRSRSLRAISPIFYASDQHLDSNSFHPKNEITTKPLTNYTQALRG